ncbi:hypothetical protein BIT28_16400 [Photobacterium proteolyticum]|uniref:Uncharacterized protein n=1 Tax=Photobacterium proteolyticum TaxID=1903952 RepID=A0A1Q9G7P2_9GAMM|nr:hypothetical protein [Photobacterium proteolyticum]OLQ70306.1 hypothetical protein BIT28_16400 [Photobacterium proteolyticum]
MAIKFDDCDFSKNETGVKAPSSADVSFQKTRFTENTTAVDIYITKEDIIALGLPDNTDPELVKEAVSLLKEHEEAPHEVKSYLLNTTKLFKWLGNISSLTTIGTALIDFAKS